VRFGDRPVTHASWKKEAKDDSELVANKRAKCDSAVNVEEMNLFEPGHEVNPSPAASCLVLDIHLQQPMHTRKDSNKRYTHYPVRYRGSTSKQKTRELNSYSPLLRTCSRINLPLLLLTHTCVCVCSRRKKVVGKCT
jgi:hypothetical protein